MRKLLLVGDNREGGSDMFLHVKLIRVDAKMPTRGITPGVAEVRDPSAVGYDLYAPEDGTVDPLQRAVIGLGLCSAFAEGWVGRVCDRSGMAAKGLHVLGGVIDPGYRGEWKLILYNTGGVPYHYRRGDRLAQVVFSPAWVGEAVEVAELDAHVSVRGESGLGSTGA